MHIIKRLGIHLLLTSRTYNNMYSFFLSHICLNPKIRNPLYWTVPRQSMHFRNPIACCAQRRKHRETCCWGKKRPCDASHITGPSINKEWCDQAKWMPQQNCNCCDLWVCHRFDVIFIWSWRRCIPQQNATTHLWTQNVSLYTASGRKQHSCL